MKHSFLALAATLLSSCALTSRESAPPSEAIYGWLAGNCLALSRSNLRTPRDFTLVDLSHDSKRIHGEVLRVATDTDNCPALLSDRQEVNKASGNSFYVVKLDAPSDLGIGIIGKVAVEPLSFGQCMTSEGVRFTVMRGSQQVWTGYYYLGYDSEATCPNPDAD